ncbi:MAG TPA: oligoendopeptidase F, partial [Rhodothermales bacterium]
MSTEFTGAEDVRWNLSDLYETPENLRDDLARTEQEAENFARQYRGQVAALDAAGFAEALGRYEAVLDRIGAAYTYAYLNWSTNTEDAARGALMQSVREAYS